MGAKKMRFGERGQEFWMCEVQFDTFCSVQGNNDSYTSISSDIGTLLLGDVRYSIWGPPMLSNSEKNLTHKKALPTMGPKLGRKKSPSPGLPFLGGGVLRFCGHVAKQSVVRVQHCRHRMASLLVDLNGVILDLFGFKSFFLFNYAKRRDAYVAYSIYLTLSTICANNWKPILRFVGETTRSSGTRFDLRFYTPL